MGEIVLKRPGVRYVPASGRPVSGILRGRKSLDSHAAAGYVPTMKTFIILLFLATLLASGVAVITNPKEAEHRALANKVLLDALVSRIPDQGDMTDAMKNHIRERLGEELAGYIGFLNLKYENKYLFSRMTAELKGVRIVTQGGFNKVTVLEARIPPSFFK